MVVSRVTAGLCLVVAMAACTPSGDELRARQATTAGQSVDGIEMVDVDPVGTLSPASLPKDIHPLATAAADLEPFLGIWRGQWEGTLDTILTVTASNERGVTVFYAWGTNAITRSPGQRYIRGVVHNGVMLLPGHGMSISLKPQEDGSLFGLFYSPRVHMPSRIVLRRVS
ncbi:hypothetical protein [Tistrella mobilis]|uniref:hypothetical protein n=1 Tax=Tistrella mobilis TaxID=171437 RepID=UPI00355685FE